MRGPMGIGVGKVGDVEIKLCHTLCILCYHLHQERLDGFTASRGLLRLPHLALQESRSLHRSSSTGMTVVSFMRMLMPMVFRSSWMLFSHVVGG